MGTNYQRCIVCGESATSARTLPGDYDRAGNHIGACYCADHQPRDGTVRRIRRTDCGCIASRPEPSPADYLTDAGYDEAHATWQAEWQLVADAHVYDCPKSAYYHETPCPCGGAVTCGCPCHDGDPAEHEHTRMRQEASR